MMQNQKPYTTGLVCPGCGSRCTEPRPYAPSFECGGPHSIECKRRQQEAHDRMEAAPLDTTTFPTPWSELETKHVEHFDWPQWRVNADREVEVRIPTSFATVEVTITRLDAKAMLADLEEAAKLRAIGTEVNDAPAS